MGKASAERRRGGGGERGESPHHLEAQQRWSGAAGDKLQQLALFVICESFDHLPEDLDDGMSG